MDLNLSEITIERCDKETEDVISKETPTFLSTSLKHVKIHQNEFIYLESPAFEDIRVDAISIELDDVFKTYTALLGLSIQKKHTAAIKKFLDEYLIGENKYYSASFSGDEGIWDLNIPLDYVKGFSEEMTIADALSLTYQLIQTLLTEIKQ